jgi:hypothetical protein
MSDASASFLTLESIKDLSPELNSFHAPFNNSSETVLIISSQGLNKI